jgi:hypothetical protein
MKAWQDKIMSSSELIADVFEGKEAYPTDDYRWWALKQHFDDDPITGGTRLIDWTSSPLTALYFACVNWDGSIDDSIDGALFLAPLSMGRRMASEEFIEAHVDKYDRDWYDVSGKNLETYFNLPNRLDGNPNKLVRTLITEHDNSRQLSQDGHFIFSPVFDEPITDWGGSSPYCLTIPATSKKEIASELYSIGLTPKKIVRGKKGLEAHHNLRKQLNIQDII